MLYTPEELDKAYHEGSDHRHGWDDRDLDYSYDNNPYPENSELFDSWESGYYNAEQDIMADYWDNYDYTYPEDMTE